MNYHKVPSTLQMEAADCGAASLKMLLDDLNYEYTLEELRNIICVGRDGSSLRDIINGGLKIGFEIEPVRGNYKDAQFNDVPLLMFWNRNHFVVYEGKINNKFVINDPAEGRRFLLEEEFSKSFSGIMLKIISKPKNIDSYKSPNLIKENTILRSLISDSYKEIIVALIISLFLSLPTVATAQLTSYFIDQILLRGESTLATQFLWIFFFLCGVTALLKYTSTLIANKATLINTVYKTYLVIKSITNSSLRWIESRNVSEIVSRPLLAATTTRSLSYDSITIISAVFQSIIITFVILFINVWLGLVCISLIALQLYISQWIDKQTETDNKRMAIEYGKQAGVALTTLTSLRVIRSANLENIRFSQWAGLYTNYVNAQQKVSRKQVLAGLVSNSSFYIANTALIILGPILIITKQLSLGNFVAIQYLLGLVTNGIKVSPALLTLYQSVKSPVERLRDSFESPKDEVTNSRIDLNEIEIKKAELDIKNISFSYNGKQNIFSEFTFKNKIGPINIIKTKPGGGKTTFLNLLIGNYEIDKGEISFNINEKSFSAGSYKCTFIPSVPTLIDGNVFENISLTDKRIKEKKVYRIASLLGINGKDSIDLNYRIINFGEGLTIKEKNQISLARALVSPDKFIFFDDFNPQIDEDILKIFFDELRKENRIIFLTTNMEDNKFPSFNKIVIN